MHLRANNPLLVLAALSCGPLAAAVHEVGPTTPLVLSLADVAGGTDVRNNAKHNPGGGYLSVYDGIKEFAYPSTHGNQLGNTALVNDHVYWDSSPGGLDYTHTPHPDPGCGSTLWWPIPGEWTAYQFTVSSPGTYSVLCRFSSSWGPAKPAMAVLTIDGVASAPVPLTPDDAKLWSDTHYQVGGWWGHTMVSGTFPVAWALGTGAHVLQVRIDSFPDKPTDHGNLWVHYFKITSSKTAGRPPAVVLKPVVPRQLAAANAAFKTAEECEQKGRLGQAIAAYEKAAGGAAAGSDLNDRATAKAKSLREAGEQKLADARALAPEAAAPVLARIASDYAGCGVGDAARQASPGQSQAPSQKPTADTGTAGWTPPDKQQALSALRTMIVETAGRIPVEATITLFGKPQAVVVTRCDKQGLDLRLAGSGSEISLQWPQLGNEDLGRLGQACILGRADQAMSVGEWCIACGLDSLAKATLNRAAELDPRLSPAVAERLQALQAKPAP
ncbi:MAG: hypothetical protein H0X38_01845 [Planctomycetes bacterium]|nr:hypothetical protein [Planctomycetota bacterium]